MSHLVTSGIIFGDKGDLAEGKARLTLYHLNARLLKSEKKMARYPGLHVTQSVTYIPSRSRAKPVMTASTLDVRLQSSNTQQTSDS